MFDHLLDLYRQSTTDQPSGHAGVTYTAVTTGIPFMVQPLSAKDAFFWQQANTEITHQLFTETIAAIETNDLLVEPSTGRQFLSVGPRDQCTMGVMLVVDALEYLGTQKVTI